MKYFMRAYYEDEYILRYHKNPKYEYSGQRIATGNYSLQGKIADQYYGKDGWYPVTFSSRLIER